MRFLTSLLVLTLGGALLASAPAQAQQQAPTDTSDNADPALPEIAPREIEIRGTLDISLPALRRPAMTGLLPATRLQPLPPAPPPPAMNALSPSDDDASPTLAEEATPSSGFSELPPPEGGLFEAGAGRYLSRFARARLDLALAPRWAVRSRLDYTGTDGFTPFGEDGDASVKTPEDELRGAITLRTEQPGFTAALTADGSLGQHQLYGAVAGNDDVAAYPARDRAGGGVAMRVQAGSSEGATLEARARYDAAQVTTGVLPGEDAAFDRSEQRVEGSVGVGGPVGGVRVEADVQGSTARLYGAEDGTGGSTSFVDAGAGVWLLRGGALRVFAGARVLSFSTDPGGDFGNGTLTLSTYPDDGTFLAPDVRLTWQAGERLALYARTGPGIEANPLADRYRENPSLLSEYGPQPTVSTLDAEGGLRFFPVPALELRAFAGYQRAQSFLFYESERVYGYERGVTAARYGEARIGRAGGALSYRRGERLHASLSAAYRSGRLDGPLDEGDADIPYFSPFIAEALVGVGFSDGKGRFELTGSLESARPTGRIGNAEVGTFADLDVEGRYAITPAVGLVVKLQNIPASALERFDHYPRPPLVFETGLRLRL